MLSLFFMIMIVYFFVKYFMLVVVFFYFLCIELRWFVIVRDYRCGNFFCCELCLLLWLFVVWVIDFFEVIGKLVDIYVRINVYGVGISNYVE